MSDRFAYFYQPLKEFDLRRFVSEWSAAGVVLFNPSNMQNRILDLQLCPGCGESLSGHEFALIASMIDAPNHKFRL
jgi:hypothetical protein